MKYCPRKLIRVLSQPYRLATANSRSLPDFIIVGTQKGGTSSLFYYLSQHPQVTPAIQKEIHYFDNAYEKGERWYKARFPVLKKNGAQKVITGEASPYYIFHPYAVKRIARDVPNAKLIVLLRNPVERAYSHYQMATRKGMETLSFEEAVEIEESRLKPEIEMLDADESYRSYVHQSFSYVARGFYADQLERLFKHVSRENVLILNSEAFFSNPQHACDKAFTLLGVSPFILRNAKAVNFSTYPRDIPRRERLRALYESHNKRLYELLGVEFDW